MLFNINTKKWDDDLLKLFKIPKNILPKVKNSIDNYGNVVVDDILIPIYSVAGDQQAALFGHGCVYKNDNKCTYGTGLFYLINTGKKRIDSTNKLLTTLIVGKRGTPSYALEGSVFIGGAVIQWLRDELKIIKNASETDKIANTINDNNGVYIVPAFVGLGAPHWNSNCKGIITGLTRGTNRSHIIRASLESIAYQANDLFDSIYNDIKTPIRNLNVDGGATNNDFLLQFQSDISNVNIIKPKNIEITSLGVAMMAGLKNGFFKNIDSIIANKKFDKIFKPKITNSQKKSLINGWNDALKKAML